jgi:hypothetical protein
MAGFTRPSITTKPLMSESPRLDTSELRKLGVLVPGARTHGTIEFANPSETPILLVHYVADLSIQDAYIELQHQAPGASPAPPYRLQVTRISTPCAGARLHIVCPITGVNARRLYCPIIDSRFADCFGSSAAFDLCRPSDRYAVSHRALRHLQRVEQRAEARMATAHPAKKGYRGGRGLGAKTIARMNAEIAAADAAVWLQTARAANRRPAAGRASQLRPSEEF